MCQIKIRVTVGTSKIEVNGQRRVGKRVGQRRQLFRQDDRALRGEVGDREAARLLERRCPERAVALDRELDDGRARRRSGAAFQLALDARDHRHEVVGTAEVGDVERREPAPGPPPVERPKPWPRAPVTATALPALVSAPRVGVRPRASSGACLTAADDGFRRLGSGVRAPSSRAPRPPADGRLRAARRAASPPAPAGRPSPSCRRFADRRRRRRARSSSRSRGVLARLRQPGRRARG